MEVRHPHPGLPARRQADARRCGERSIVSLAKSNVQDSCKSLTTAQLILIDRITTKLGVVRCMEEHIREHSVFEGNELAPCLRASYLAYQNSLRHDLQALGIDRKTDVFLAPFEIVANEAKEEDSDEHS